MRELILATNPTVEGEATAHFLGELAARLRSGRAASRTACPWAASSNMWMAARWRMRSRADSSLARSRVPSSEHLIWIDLEMTGLKPDTDHIIEIATVVTDKDLNVLAEGPEARDPSARRGAGGDGRVEPAPARRLGPAARVRASDDQRRREAERSTLAFLAPLRRARAPRRCAATASARTGASSRQCRSWSGTSTTATST